MQQNSLAQLNLLALPSVDLLGDRGWDAVSGLLEAPGCYAVVCTVAKRRVWNIDQSQLDQLKPMALNLMGEHLRPVVNATEAGGYAAVILYIGYSKNLNNRWAGSRVHHKQADLQATSYVLNSIFDVTALRLHWVLAPSGEAAEAVETELIKLWRPVLNGRSPIVKKAA